MNAANNSCESTGEFPGRFRTIQLHPTRRCNLACLHCYSNSEPSQREMIDLNATKWFLKYAFEKGFNNISLSGGEPFLYNNLEALLGYCKETGYQVTMATNGMMLGSERNQNLLKYVDLVAVSIDGQEGLHDHIRAKLGAYTKMLEGVEVLRKHRKAFGFIHTVSPQSWESLIWLGEFAVAQGAKLLQLHPLEMAGRANAEMGGEVINEELAHKIYILTEYLRQKHFGELIIQLDMLHRDYLLEFPQVVSAFERSCGKKKAIKRLNGYHYTG